MRSILIIFCILYFFTGCSREDGFLPDLEGSLVGFIYTFDEFANLLDDHSNVTVSALGVQKVYRTLTDASGRFELKNLPVGNYELHIEKPGFGTMKQFGIHHLGGKPTVLGLSYSAALNSEAFFIYEMPTTKILGLSLENDSLTGDFIFTDQEPDRIRLLMYFSTEQDFRVEEASCQGFYWFYNNAGTYKCKIAYCLRNYTGEEVYCRAFMLANENAIYDFDNRLIAGIDSYYDYESNTTIYPNMGEESPVFSFVVQ